MKRLFVAGMMGALLLLVGVPAAASARPMLHPITIDIRATAKGEHFAPSRFAATPLRVTVIVVRNLHA